MHVCMIIVLHALQSCRSKTIFTDYLTIANGFENEFQTLRPIEHVSITRTSVLNHYFILHKL